MEPNLTDNMPRWVSLTLAIAGGGFFTGLASWYSVKMTAKREDRSQTTTDYNAVNAAARGIIEELRQESARVRVLLKHAEEREEAMDAEHRKDIERREVAFEELMKRYKALMHESDLCARNFVKALHVLREHGVSFTADDR